MATITKRGDSYRIRVSDGYDIHGKQKMRSMTWTPEPGMSERQIEKELERQKVLFEEKCRGGAGACNIKFEAFSKRWFREYAEKQLRPRTIALMHGLEERTYQAIGHLRMDKITALQIQSFIHNLAEPGINKKTNGGLSPKTQGHYLTFISDVFNYAVQMDLLKDNPARRVKIAKGEPKEKDIYTIEEAQKFLDHLEEEPLRLQAFCVLAIYGGFRRAEILGLEWKDVDFDKSVVTIRRTSQYTKELGIFTDTTKTKGSQRSLKLPAGVMEILRKYKLEQSKKRLSLGDQWHNTDRLFTRWNGLPIGTSSFSKWIAAYCKKIGLRYLGIHSFRHLNASLLIYNGVDIRTVSASLGHSQTSTTLNIYAHTIAQAQAEGAEAIAEALPLKSSQKSS